MKKLRVKQHADNFRKKDNQYLYDNKNDEVLLNILELYPNKQTSFFKGKEGAAKRKLLQQKVRDAFDKEQEHDEYENAGGKVREKLKSTFSKIKGGYKKAAKGLSAGAKKVGHGVATAALAPARGSALGLIRLNYRALASKMAIALEYPEAKEKMLEKWSKLGGIPEKLILAIRAGQNKPMFLCGMKCRAKAGKNPQLPSDASSDFVNVAGADDAGIAAMIASGAKTAATILTSVTAIIGGLSKFRKVDSELNQKEKEEKAIDATMTDQERKISMEVIKAQESGFDPIEAIKNNPNLTAEEKIAAIAEIEEAESKENSSNSKVITFVIVASVLLGVYFIYNKNKQ